MIAKYIRGFFESVHEALCEVNPQGIQEVVEALQRAYGEGRSVYIMGNGGSAASASHLACDLSYAEGKRTRLRVVSLNENVPLFTALANDLGHSEVFKSQLEQSLAPGDVVMVLSVSGDSENILKAVEYARQCKALTVGFLGSAGGRAQSLLDLHLTMSSTDFPVVESAHCVLIQAVAAAFRKCILQQSGI